MPQSSYTDYLRNQPRTAAVNACQQLAEDYASRQTTAGGNSRESEGIHTLGESGQDDKDTPAEDSDEEYVYVTSLLWLIAIYSNG